MNSSATSNFASQELAHYLKRMGIPMEEDNAPKLTLMVRELLTGLTPPLQAELDDQYAIEAGPSDIAICGTNPRALLLGVYRLLTELGCRFLGPAPGDELVPLITAEQLHVHLSEAASYRHRGVCIEGANSVENVIAFIDWLPKLGMNSFFIQFKEPTPFLERWYKHTYNPTIPADPLWIHRQSAIYRQIDEAIALRGLLHHRVGHGWTSEAVGVDTVCNSSDQPLPEKQISLLAEVGGKRELIRGVASNTNLCYSNPAAAERFVDCVVSYAVAHAELDYLHVWLADEYNNLCECDDCAATTLSDQYVELLNEIDRRLTAESCGTKIAMLLYQELLWAPIKARLHDPRRFVMMFAPISRTFESSYRKLGAIGAAPEYRRNSIVLPNSLEENLAFLQGWQKQYNVDSFVYDYPLGRAHYGDLGYYHIAQIISEDIQALAGMRLNGYVSCQELRAGLPNFFPNYVMGKTLWNSSRAFAEVADEYFCGAYGTSNAQSVQSYLSQLSQLSSCDYFNGIGDRVNPQLARSFGAAAALAQDACDNVSARCGTALEQNFFQRLDYHAKYCKLIAKALGAQASGDAAGAAGSWHEFISLIRRSELRFQPYLDVYRVLEVATKYTGFALDMPR